MTCRKVTSTCIKECTICQDPKRNLRNRRKLEALTTCATLEVRATLANAARVRNDQHVLLQTQGVDVVAAEVCYHRSCFARYTLRKELEKLLERPPEGLSTSSEDEIPEHDVGLELVLTYMEHTIIAKPTVCTLAGLRKRISVRGARCSLTSEKL